MTVRRPKPESAARILMRALSELGLSIKYTQAQELLAKVQGFKHANALRAHAKKSTTVQPPAITCPVIRLGAPPLTAEVLEQLERKDDIRAIVEIDQNELFEFDLDGFLDLVSERMTGSLCGLSDIGYQAVSLPQTDRGAIAFEITAAEIMWETLDEKPGKSPSRRLAALEFGPNQFNEVLEVDFSEDLFAWLEGDRSASEDEGDLEVITYEYDGTAGVNHVTLADLVNARLDADGKLTLEDGSEIYLIDQNRERWVPRVLTSKGRKKAADLIGSEDVYPGESADREKYLAQIGASKKAPKSPDLSGINYFVHSFRTHPSSLTARTLRKVADEDLKEGLIKKADHEAYFKETAAIIAEWRKTPDGQPNPKLPFYGCELPKEILAVDLVSSDARAADWHSLCTAEVVSDSMLEWLESGMPESEQFELDDEALSYEDGDSMRSLTARDLTEASLAKDGRFELKGGTEFYLIDETGKRWFPKDRV